MEQGTVAPIPAGYKLSANASAVLETLKTWIKGNRLLSYGTLL
jgi:hypothetical protein